MKTLASLFLLAFTLSLQAGTMTWNLTSRKTEQPAIWLLSTNGTAAAPGVAFYQDQDTGMYRSATNAIGFATAGTGRWIITATGDVIPVADGTYSIGDGTTDPLHINFTGNLVNGATSITPTEFGFLDGLTSSAQAQLDARLTSSSTLNADNMTTGTLPIARVADGAVTLAKLANLATQRVIGRNTGSTGVPESVTATQILDWIGSTRGSILYRGASGWTILTPGTSGHALLSQGAGADPIYGAVSGSQTPWTQDINADEFSLTNVTSIVGTGSGTTVIENTAGLNITNTPVTIEDPLTIVGTIELGHASDSTLSRGAAGFLAVEGKRIASPASAVAGDVMYFDGTEWVRLAKGTAGQVLEMNAGATAPEWDTDDNSGSATAFDAIGDSAANGSVSIGHTNIWTFTLDGSRFLQILSSDADNAADTTLLTLAFNDGADANSIFADFISDADGTPSSVWKVSATAITTTLPISGATMDAGNNAFTSWPVEIGIACSDETTAITTGTAKATFRVPFAFTLTAVRASVGTAPTGSTIIIDVNENGTTVLSTKLTIDATEETTETAAAGEVISDSAIADDSEITIDFDQVGSSTAGAGVKVWLIGTRTI